MALNVVLACDETFVGQAAVAIHSALATAKCEVNVLLLHAGLNDAQVTALATVLGPFGSFTDQSISSSDRALKLPSYLPETSTFRLRVPEFAPADWDYAIYLDADVLVVDSLVHLWDKRLSVDFVGMVQDTLVPHFGSPYGPPWDEVGVNPTSAYFNAGVMLLNVGALRESGLFSEALRLLERHQFPYGDQCAINVALQGLITQLDPRFNVMAGHFTNHNSIASGSGKAALTQTRSNAVIIHFNSSDEFRRPWFKGCTHPRKLAWLDEYATVEKIMDFGSRGSAASGSNERLSPGIQRFSNGLTSAVFRRLASALAYYREVGCSLKSNYRKRGLKSD